LNQQALVINYLDECAAELGRLDMLSIWNACVLMLSFQYGLRPGQIARIETRDVRIFETGAVHISIWITKQRNRRKAVRVVRRIKREWGPLFTAYIERRGANESDDPDRLFGLTPGKIGDCLAELFQEIAGERWTATDARHTAAQRLADAGVPHVALSEFLIHACTRTANVYFNASPTQAQRVNEALAISPIYAAIAEVARTRTIDKKTLLGLPEDKQIGGVPHGIPIAGIGGCDIGQSLCSKNPVLSCYTCRRFLPLNDPTIHERVVMDRSRHSPLTTSGPISFRTPPLGATTIATWSRCTATPRESARSSWTRLLRAAEIPGSDVGCARS
jgi:hypothetical protein